MKNRIKEYDDFLKDLTFNAKFRILEEATDKEKLLEIATKKGIVLPAHDLSIFECIYAYTDRQNKNGCTLPKEEVEKSLNTLIGKSIDLDHLRKNVVGHWIDAKLDGDTIYAYGAVFKSSFEEDFEVIKELFAKGNLAVSFEAWGEREFTNYQKTTYTLHNIEFAGGALLLRSEPAFPGAGVLEMAKSRVLEMAKVMTPPKEYFHTKNDDIETARYYVYDTENIMRSLYEVECLNCKEKGCMEPMLINYADNQAKVQCYNCDAEMAVELTPAATLSKKGRKVKKMQDWAFKASVEGVEEFIKDVEVSDERLNLILEESMSPFPKLNYSDVNELTDEDFAVVKTIELSKDKNRKIRIMPIHNLAQIEYVQANVERPFVIALLEKLSISKDMVDRKINRRIINIAMKTLLEKYKKGTPQEVIQEVAKATINRELSKEELETAQLSVTNLQTLKKGKGGSSDQSLKSVGKPATPANDNHAKEANAPSNETSLQTAEITEDELKAVITEVTKEKASTTDVTKDAEIAALKVVIADLTSKVEGFEKAKRDAEKAELDAKVKARRDELGEFAKDLKDEDVLDETKYELAKTKKELAEVKGGKTKETATTTVVKDEKKPDLAMGAADKEKLTAEATSRSKIDELAWGSENQNDDDK